ncbi:MAG: aldehyde dehydrogenase family protein [Candidatus Eremiobacteraeota bacterium]|nr:aldehyde dehydrogenase family protein [Candidatus Eremiobacteraeota bacterium]
MFDYAPAPESTAPVSLRPRYGHFIGGEWVEPLRGGFFDSISPATEEKLTEVAYGTIEDVERAVRAARRAYEKFWRKTKPAERAKFLYRLARAITERSREFAVLETMDGGKPIKESRDFDVPQAAQHFFYHGGWADKLRYAIPGSTSPSGLGVVGSIVPWNFPLLMAAWKLAPALACGNTIVLKPAETTPLTALLLAEVCAEADLPPGVVNVVTGDGATGAALVDAEVDKIAFTGSTDVGRHIGRAVAGTKKRLTLELGGKAAQIVFSDAPLDQAVEGIVAGIYFNQGHVCCAGSRLLVQESVHDEVVARLHKRIGVLRVGDPLDKNTDIGAINSKMQLEKIRELVQSGIEEGGQLVQAACAIPERGFWFPPTFFTGIAPNFRIAREEIFGPVLAVLTFRTADEAIEKANNTPYGLSAGVWTDKGSKNMYVAQRLRAGVVWCNTFNQFDPSSPFGGYRESGFGREGGLAGLREYLAR